MPFVTSKDGTRIGYDTTGGGPALILVDGAMCYRAFGPSTQLAPLLAPHFTVFTYDRRGRGESGDAPTYDITREVEDLEALIDAAGGSAMLYGVSSGAALALEVASKVRTVTKLALYEAPFIVDNSRSPITSDYWGRISQAVAANRRGTALSLFLRAVGVPGFVVMVMRLTSIWKKLKTIAHTLPYDGALVWENQQGRQLTARRWRSISAPTLVMDGGNSPPWMRNGTRALADALPNAVYRTLPGQTHMVKANVHAPVLIEFFRGSASDALSVARSIHAAAHPDLPETAT